MLKNKSIWIKVLAYLLVAVISFFLLFSVFSTQKMSDDSDSTQTYLNEKRGQILALTASTATIALGISVLPDDVGSALADQIARISGVLAIILSAIYLEKTLVTFSGLIAFRLLIPIACLLFICDVLKPNAVAKNIARRFCALALALMCVVPISIFVSKKIESNIVSTNSIVATETQSSDDAQEKDKIGTEKAATKVKQDNEADESSKSKNVFTSIIGGIQEQANNIKEQATALVGKSQEKYEDLKNKAVNTIEEMVDKVAIMLITACVIPLIVLIFLIWFLKILFNIDLFGKFSSMKEEMNAGRNNNAE